jgi:anti-sigma regulatory factor (Ser/Thr protein kinase)
MRIRETVSKSSFSIAGGAPVELRQSFSSEVKAISSAVDQLMRFIATLRNADGSETDVEIASREAVANAVIHGNKEDPSKRAYLTRRCCADGETSIAVRDERCGFENV